MKREERITKMNRVYDLLIEADEILTSIVWEKQEGQEDHFDELHKLEQVRLSGCYCSVKQSKDNVAFLNNAYKADII